MPHMLPPETSSPKRPNKELLSLLQEMAYEETAGDEVEDLLALLAFAKQLHPEIEAVSSGAIASDYQRLRVEHVRDPCSFSTSLIAVPGENLSSAHRSLPAVTTRLSACKELGQTLDADVPVVPVALHSS